MPLKAPDPLPFLPPAPFIAPRNRSEKKARNRRPEARSQNRRLEKTNKQKKKPEIGARSQKPESNRAFLTPSSMGLPSNVSDQLADWHRIRAVPMAFGVAIGSSDFVRV
jgi:hypothetical protein